MIMTHNSSDPNKHIAKSHYIKLISKNIKENIVLKIKKRE